MAVTLIGSPCSRWSLVADHEQDSVRRNQPPSLGALLRFWMFFPGWWECFCISGLNISDVLYGIWAAISVPYHARVDRVISRRDRFDYIRILLNYEDHTAIDSYLGELRYGKSTCSDQCDFLRSSLMNKRNQFWISLSGGNHTNLSLVITVIRRFINQGDLIGVLMISQFYLANHLQKEKLRSHLFHHDRTKMVSLTFQNLILSIFIIASLIMAYFGKMVAPRDKRKRLSPIQMPDFDDSAIIKQFEKTLVGRVLNPTVSKLSLRSYRRCGKVRIESRD
ncbi:unnamed protein product [Arabis nemorensis]|uniref:Uncharacterized protein n=1 Tax=Arabis nemorensis TaxID=586526 RepID=A0A565CGZ5_9BRAS|nr:unnamed protein product [Arabis nemorensis]